MMRFPGKVGEIWIYQTENDVIRIAKVIEARENEVRLQWLRFDDDSRTVNETHWVTREGFSNQWRLHESSIIAQILEAYD